MARTSSSGSIRRALLDVLDTPDPSALWVLRSELLTSGVSPVSDVWAILTEFREFLDRLATGTSSREYSELASKLDIGAVGGVVLEQVLESEDAGDLAQRFLMGLVSEGLMILATRQHVRAWEGEIAAVHRGAAWFLYERLWRWAEERKPELPAAERRELVDRLFRPLVADEASDEQKTILIGRLFQVLLISSLGRELRPV